MDRDDAILDNPLSRESMYSDEPDTLAVGSTRDYWAGTHLKGHVNSELEPSQVRLAFKNRSVPLLVFADDWGRHPSSCQHLVQRLRTDFPVLWVNSIGTRQVRADTLTMRRVAEKLRNWSKGLQQVDSQMWVLDLPMLPGQGSNLVKCFNHRLVTARLARTLRTLKLADPIIITTLPYMMSLIPGLARRATIYYCTDDYSHWPSADRDVMQQADRELTASADAVLAVSQSLCVQHAANSRCIYFPHGVDHSHFAAASRLSDCLPADLDILPGPRIGFFGLVYEKLDFSLIEKIARRFPHASLVLIGSVVHRPAHLESLPNVHFLGPRQYEDLPRYIAGLDVLLLPYLADDPMIRQSGPLKLRECLASGKPTVSVDVPEVRVLEPHVQVATSHEEFLEYVAQSLVTPQLESQALRRSAAVAEHDWSQRAAKLRDILIEMTESGVSPAPWTKPLP